MYAIFRTGNRQYRVEVGSELNLEKLPHEVGDKVEFSEVLLIGDGSKTSIGKPLVKSAAVKATVLEQFKGKKIIVWKYRPRKGYRRKYGHRQFYTRLHVDDIVLPKPKATTKAKPESTAKKSSASKPAAKKSSAKKDE